MNRPRTSAERRAHKRNVAWQNEQKRRVEKDAARRLPRNPAPKEARPNV